MERDSFIFDRKIIETANKLRQPIDQLRLIVAAIDLGLNDNERDFSNDVLLDALFSQIKDAVRNSQEEGV